jgi:hypothetical protein
MDKFIRFHRNGIYNVVHEDIAKQYALIAVEELIKETGSKYWYDVKQEIENL